MNVLCSLWTPHKNFHTKPIKKIVESKEILKVHDFFYFAGLSNRRRRRDSSDNGSRKGEEGVRRHCGKTAPEDFLDGDSAVELVFHTNQGDACKGFAFQYRLETSNSSNFASFYSITRHSAAYISNIFQHENCPKFSKCADSFKSVLDFTFRFLLFQ